MEGSKKNKVQIDLINILKFVGAVVAALPLLLGFLEYKKSVQEITDKNFREIVAHLASEKKAERFASATKLGTFIEEGNDYNDNAIDILVNMILIEWDPDILQAISGSLTRVDHPKAAFLVQKLLNLDNYALSHDALNYRLKHIQNINQRQFENIKKLEIYLPRDKKLPGDNNNSVVRSSHKISLAKYEESLIREKEVEEQLRNNPIREDLISGFTINLLSKYRMQPIKRLVLYQKAWSYYILRDLILPEIKINSSAITAAFIENSDFTHALIQNSTFANSKIMGANFSDSTISRCLFDNIMSLQGTSFKNAIFKDVFFTNSDIGGADFTGIKDLNPNYFFKAKNIDKATFDEDFKKQLKTEVGKITDEMFIDYLNSSTLTRQRTMELLENNYLIDKANTQNNVKSGK